MTPPPPWRVMTERDDSWRPQAACRGLPTGLFFPDLPRPDRVGVAEAKAVCAACPVAGRCLTAGMAETYGIWGGFSAAERRAARRAQRREAA